MIYINKLFYHVIYVIIQYVRQYILQIIDAVVPHRCINCGIALQGLGFCANCWMNISFINECCEKCGQVTKAIKKHICEEIQPCDLVRALTNYNISISNTILKLKHQDMPYIAEVLGCMIYNRYHNLIKQCDIIIPVPIHWKRLLQRGYNQAGLLAQQIGLQANIITHHYVLQKVIHSAPQGTMNIPRTKNVTKNHFIVTKTNYIKNKTIALIDDVFTSGTTAKSCAEALKQAGAKQVFVFVVAITDKE